MGTRTIATTQRNATQRQAAQKRTNGRKENENVGEKKRS